MAVDEDQGAGVVIEGTGEAAVANVFVETVVADVEAGGGAQGVGEGAPAVVADIGGGQEGDAGGGLADGLFVFGDARDGLDG